MGKGTIVSEIGGGQYIVQVNYDRVTYDEEILALTKKIAELQLELAKLEAENYG